MESNNKYSSAASSRCPDASTLWKYAHGKLSAMEQYDVELHAVDCPLCAAAVDGYGDVKDVPALKEVRNRLFSGSSFLWTAVSVVAGVMALWWVSNYFNSVQREPARFPPVSVLQDSLPESADAITSPALLNDSSVTLNSVSATPAELKTERLRRWGEELFMIEKRSVEPLQTVPVDAGVKKQSRFKVIYLEGLKVVEYQDRFADAKSLIEIDRGLHPRYANNADMKREAFFTDTDTVMYQDLLVDALRAFNLGACRQVVGQLQVIGDRYPDDQNVWFYSGMCEQRMGELKNALQHFSRMLNDETSPFYEEALWHTALCLEESGNKEEALKLFRRIADADGFYAAPAARRL